MNALQRLIAIRGEFGHLIEEAHVFLREIRQRPIEASPVVLLCRADVDQALKRYVDGGLTERQLHEWAELLEMNDNIDYEAGEEEAIADVLFRLSTPDINEPISENLARRLRVELNA